MKWKIDYHNDVGASDEGFWQWWTVNDGCKFFECANQSDAQWLCDLLNSFSPTMSKGAAQK
jgi:hypothetical protein